MVDRLKWRFKWIFLIENYFIFRVGVNSIPELELQLNSIPIPELELKLVELKMELELKSLELELELELKTGIEFFKLLL